MRAKGCWVMRPKVQKERWGWGEHGVWRRDESTQGQGRGEESRGAQKQAGGRHWAPLEPVLSPHRILRLMLLHIKYLYGIRVEVRGAHHFPPSQPYVVVSNHQSSLDLLGETPPRTHLPRPCPSFWNFLQNILSWRSSTLPHLGPCHLSQGYSSPHL